jgi:hypothetical protein
VPSDDLFDHALAGINRGDRVAGTALAQQVLARRRATVAGGASAPATITAHDALNLIRLMR